MNATDNLTPETRVEDIRRAYDLYLAEGTNPINTRNMIGYGAEVNALYTQLKKHDYPTHVELDLHVAALPVYDRTESVKTGSKLYATYGISFVLADEYQDPANSHTLFLHPAHCSTLPMPGSHLQCIFCDSSVIFLRLLFQKFFDFLESVPTIGLC